MIVFKLSAYPKVDILQVMEEKLDNKNVELASVKSVDRRCVFSIFSNTKFILFDRVLHSFRIYSTSELEAVIQRL